MSLNLVDVDDVASLSRISSQKKLMIEFTHVFVIHDARYDKLTDVFSSSRDYSDERGGALKK